MLKMSESIKTLIIIMFGYLVVGDVLGKIIMYVSGLHPIVTCVVEEEKK